MLEIFAKFIVLARSKCQKNGREPENRCKDITEYRYRGIGVTFTERYGIQAGSLGVRRNRSEAVTSSRSAHCRILIRIDGTSLRSCNLARNCVARSAPAAAR
ncbi:hypothetical protein EVAR_54602_1 [Eumeta japonica]|uniref:Uncharacterized protein n=1 Tax=Eumeta variegata TaxID=151549 RepID=A0A4C1YJT3_EUMVA|nr:hypothetical protein EVAR_54602_1 [Eumeta japonica]